MRLSLHRQFTVQRAALHSQPARKLARPETTRNTNSTNLRPSRDSPVTRFSPNFLNLKPQEALPAGHNLEPKSPVSPHTPFGPGADASKTHTPGPKASLWPPLRAASSSASFDTDARNYHDVNFSSGYRSRKILLASVGKELRVNAVFGSFLRTIHPCSFCQSCTVGHPSFFVHSPFTVKYQ